ncbi:hypothetical protein EBR25_00935 [bacterium]|nr:hypothetical protein [bacterium]
MEKRTSITDLIVSSPVVICVALSLAVCITLYHPFTNWLNARSAGQDYGVYSHYEVVYSNPGKDFGSFVVTIRPF